MGIGAFVAAMLCLTLPETKDQPTAELVRNDVNDVTVKELKDDLDREDEKMEFTSRLLKKKKNKSTCCVSSCPPAEERKRKTHLKW